MAGIRKLPSTTNQEAKLRLVLSHSLCKLWMKEVVMSVVCDVHENGFQIVIAPGNAVNINTFGH